MEPVAATACRGTEPLDPEQHGRDIEGFPRYRVTPDGHVWSRRWPPSVQPDESGWKRLKPAVKNRGHLKVHLCNATAGRESRVFIHKLVLQAFGPEKPPGTLAAHADGDPRNNSISNLSWKTHKENWDDRKRHGRGVEGSKNPCAKLSEEDVREMHRASIYATSAASLAARFGVAHRTVNNILCGKSWKHVFEDFFKQGEHESSNNSQPARVPDRHSPGRTAAGHPAEAV